LFANEEAPMIRTLTTLATAAAVALSVPVASAAAFTAPLGSNKGSLTAPVGSTKGSAVEAIVYNGHAGLGSN
jgi:hypothetical protein